MLVLICTRAGEVLLLERTRPHGFWQSVTGSLAWGEAAGAAAARELREETGLRDLHRLRDLRRVVRFPIVPPWRARYAPGTRTNLEHWFVFELPARRTIHIDRREHRQYRWMDAAEAAQRATSWTNRALIRAWQAGRRRGAVAPAGPATG